MTKNMVRLGDICTVVSGSTPKTNISEYWDGDIKWITPAELNEDSFYLHDSVRHITDLGKEKTGLTYMPSGTVILSSRAPIGKTAIAACEMCCNQGFKNLICSDKIFNEYLYFFLSAKTEFLNSLGRGATFKEISKAIVENIMIPLPGIEDQKQIAARFVQIEDLIRLRKEQLQQLDQLVKSRFIELFGDPVENPKHLPVKALKQLSVLITNGNTPKGGSENYVPKGILFIRSQNVWRNRIELDDVAFIDEKTHHSLRKSSLKHKDILITKTGRINTENSSLGRAALYLGEDDSANINGHVYLVRLDGSVVPEYVITILTSEAYRKYIRKVCVGGIDKRQINLDQVEEFPIILPPVKDQTEFATFVEHTDKLKFAVQNAVDLQITLILNLVNHPWEHWASVSNKGVKL